MTKNKLDDLNDHLFMALERLGDADLSAEDIKNEALRAEAVVKIADQITENAKTRILAAKLYAEHGHAVLDMLPAIGSGRKPGASKVIEGQPAGDN
jgi:hypothetical protein